MNNSTRSEKIFKDICYACIYWHAPFTVREPYGLAVSRNKSSSESYTQTENSTGDLLTSLIWNG